MKNRLTFLLTFVILLSSTALFSQKNKSSEIILKNGYILRGVITENNTDSVITVITEDKKVFIVKKSEIKEIKSYKVHAKDSNIKGRPLYSYTIDTGFLGFGTRYTDGFAASLILNGSYRFKDRFYAGLSTGVEYFNMPIVPVFGEFQIDLLKRNKTPFIFTRAGYAFALLPDEGEAPNKLKYKGGIGFSGGIGIKNYITDEFGLYFAAGYRHQRTVQENIYDYWHGQVDRQFFYNRLSLRVGLIF